MALPELAISFSGKVSFPDQSDLELEFATMNGQMREMKRMTEELVSLIDEEVAG